MSQKNIVPGLLLVVGLAVAAYQIGARVLAERPGPIAVVLEGDEIQRILASGGADMDTVLRQLRPLVSHIALPEQTWRDLSDLGLLNVASGPLVPQAYVPAGQTVVNLGTWTVARQFEAAMAAKGLKAEPVGAGMASATPVGKSFVLPAALTHRPELGLGYDAQTAAMIARAGFGIVARPVPAVPASAAVVEGSLKLAHDLGSTIVVFNGTEVLGNPMALSATRGALDRLGLRFGWIELSPQFGADRLAAMLGGRVLRVHSIGETEMHVLDPEAAIDRYVRAARERGMRVLYVRLLPTVADSDIVSANLAFLGELNKRLTARGFSLGDPQILPDVRTHAWTRALIALGLMGLALLLLPSLGLQRLTAPVIAVPAVAIVAAMAAAGGLFCDVVAFAGIMLAATGGLLALRPDARRLRRPVFAAVTMLVGMSVVNVLAAAMSAALLSDRLHMSGVDLFRGVKLSLFLPPLVVLMVQAARSARAYHDYIAEGGEQAEGQAIVAGLREVGGATLRYWHVVLAVVLLVGTGLMLVRSGNEPVLGRPGAELKARAALEDAFGVRPRTKEFAFGHPMLLLGLWLLYRGRKRGVWLALTLGSVGQASLANTFCHIHSPYLLGMTRASTGLVAGVAVGLLLLFLWSLAERALSRRTPA
jgi:hypothetical protein